MRSGERLAGKVAVITGGGGGIGAETARAFVDEGARVVIADLADSAGPAVADKLGEDRARFVELDVRSPVSWQHAIEVTETAFGPVTTLVGCAGVMIVAPIEETTEADFRRAFDVNVLGMFHGLQAVIPSMKRARGGSIIVFSSLSGVEGSPGLSAYSSSKAANANLAKSAAMELGAYGIRVNAIAPGGIDTPMSNGPEFAGFDKDAWYSKLPIPRIGLPSDVAPLVVLLASDEGSYFTGAVFNIDGGMSAGHTVL